MRIVTYNMKFGGKGGNHWKEIIDRHSPTVLLVQESFAPSIHLPEAQDLEAASVWTPAFNSKKKMIWGSGIYITGCRVSPIEIPEFHGWVVGAEVRHWANSPSQSDITRFFSIHAPSGFGSYQKVVNRILDCLLDFLDGSEMVIGGDFNLTVAERHIDEEKKTSKADLRIQERLREEFGLMNCWQTANPDQPLPQTLRWVSKPSVPYHCDGIFIPTDWSIHLISCDVVSGKSWDYLSDHNPMIAEFK